MILALGIGAITGDSDPQPTPTFDPRAAVSASAPPLADRDAGPCSKVLPQLPVNLGPLAARVVYTKPETPFVVAWGNPAVVFRCGEKRPAELKTGSGEEAVAAGPVTGPFYFVTRDGDANVFTTVDRAAYISVTIPMKYQGADVMPPLSNAIAKALPAVCTTNSATPDLTKLCTRRK